MLCIDFLQNLTLILIVSIKFILFSFFFYDYDDILENATKSG